KWQATSRSPLRSAKIRVGLDMSAWLIQKHLASNQCQSMAQCLRLKVCRRTPIPIGDRHFTTRTATRVAWPRTLSISRWDPVARKLWHRWDLYRSNESVVVRLTEARRG